MSVRGSVINIHCWGATARLEDGRLAAIPLGDLEANRAVYSRALGSRTPLPFDESRAGGHLVATLVRNEVADTVVPTTRAPQISNALFEAHMTAYLRETEEWMPPDRPTPIERHLIRKQRRAAQFSQEKL
ncbi:MAG TPA: hypothetical protein VN905_03965 [Candidatus Binatia bacterium]|nr:hypothetical protein [Candidatus Binatia bacterium]